MSEPSKMLPAGVSPADAFMTRCFWRVPQNLRPGLSIRGILSTTNPLRRNSLRKSKHLKDCAGGAPQSSQSCDGPSQFVWCEGLLRDALRVRPQDLESAPCAAVWDEHRRRPRRPIRSEHREPGDRAQLRRDEYGCSRAWRASDRGAPLILRGVAALSREIGSKRTKVCSGKASLPLSIAYVLGGILNFVEGWPEHPYPAGENGDEILCCVIAAVAVGYRAAQ